MPVDSTGTFRGRQSQPQQTISQNPNAASFQGLDAAANALNQTAVVLSGLHADQLRRKNRADELRVQGLQQTYLASVQKVYQQYANEPERWEGEIQKLKSGYAKEVEGLRLSDGFKGIVSEASNNYWRGISDNTQLEIQKYSAQRDRGTVLSAYDTAIKAGDVEKAISLAKDPVFKNVWKPGEQEKLIADAPKQHDLLVAEQLQATIAQSDSIAELESMLSELSEQGQDGAYSELATINGQNRAALVRSVRAQINGIEADQHRNMTDIVDGLARGDVLTDDQVDALVQRGDRTGLRAEEAEHYKALRDAPGRNPAAELEYQLDRDTPQYKDLEKRIEKSLFGEANPDDADFKTLLNDIVAAEGIKSTRAKGELINLYFRAKLADLADGETEDIGLYWLSGKVTMSDQEIKYRRKFYSQLGDISRKLPFIRGAGAALREAEKDIHKLFSTDKKLTEAELATFTRQRIQPLIDKAALEQMTGRAAQ